jgi:catechol 1,2-dioxygenase
VKEDAPRRDEPVVDAERREVAPDPSPDLLTRRVLAAYGRIEDPRRRSLVATLIEHAHACVRDLALTDEEWESAWRTMERMAAATGPERNEFLLLADVLGVSQLIETLAHEKTTTSVGSSLVGPFFRAGAPLRARGAAIMSDETEGARVHVSGRVYDATTRAPIAGARIETWQCANDGLYENQDADQPDYNLRGAFETAADGTFDFVALVPVPYPVPSDGPAGDLLRLARRSPLRAAHLHVIASAPGHETLVTQIFIEGDPTIEIDATFTADRQMLGAIRHENGVARLRYDLPLVPGRPRVPEAPIAARRPSASEVAKRFVGTWRLVDSLGSRDGIVTSVLGKDPVGYLHYSDSGVVMAQLARRDRGRPGDVGSLEREFIAYFGRYEVDAKRQVVRHILEAEVVPGQHLPIVERRFRFEGERLALHPLEPSAQGEREVIWRRAGS